MSCFSIRESWLWRQSIISSLSFTCSVIYWRSAAMLFSVQHFQRSPPAAALLSSRTPSPLWLWFLLHSSASFKSFSSAFWILTFPFYNQHYKLFLIKHFICVYETEQERERERVCVCFSLPQSHFQPFLLHNSFLFFSQHSNTWADSLHASVMQWILIMKFVIPI